MNDRTMADGPTVAGQLRDHETGEVIGQRMCANCGQRPPAGTAALCRTCIVTCARRGMTQHAWIKRMGQLSTIVEAPTVLTMTAPVQVDLPADTMHALLAAGNEGDMATVDLPAGEIPWTTPNGLMLLDTPTGDGRTFLASGYGVDTLPLPLTFAHDDDSVMGRMITCDPTGSATVAPRASGVFADTDEGRALAAQVAVGNLKSISADLRITEWEEVLIEDEMGMVVDVEFIATKFTVAGASVVTIPGFEPCQIAITATAPVAASGAERINSTTIRLTSPPGPESDLFNPDAFALKPGQYFAPLDFDAARIVADPATGQAVIRAAGGPLAPPVSAYHREATELTSWFVSDDGQFCWGHLAPFTNGDGHTGCHIGSSTVCLCAERSAANYAYFLTGEMLCDDNSRIPVGTLTLSGGHAPDDGRVPLADINAHYDNTNSAVAYLNVWDDEFGVWACGTVRAGISDEDLQALRAASPSVHEREIAGNLELVRVCMVNTPGLPVLRASGGPLDPYPSLRVRMDAAGHVVEQVGLAGAKELAALKGRRLSAPSRADYDNLAARLVALEAKADQSDAMLSALDPTARENVLARLAARG